jgi:hypothetical protein
VPERPEQISGAAQNNRRQWLTVPLNYKENSRNRVIWQVKEHLAGIVLPIEAHQLSLRESLLND